ncbi:MAG: hypothetical protein RLZZ387_5718 [Chloroflexota bacterium]
MHETDVGRAEALAAPAGSSGLQGTLPKDAERLSKLAALALALTPLLDTRRVAEMAAEHVRVALLGTRGYVLVWLRAPAQLAQQASFGEPSPQRLPFDTALGERGLCAAAIVSDALQVVPQLGAARLALAPWERALVTSADSAAVIAAPLGLGADACGALLLACNAPPCEDDLRLISAVAVAVGGALARSRAYEALEGERLSGMGRITASIAHEVNNPLQAISNSLHLLLSRSLTEDKRTRYLTMAHKEVEQLIDVVRRMLDFSRPMRDGMRPVSLHATIESVLSVAADQLAERGVMVERQLTEPLPWVSGISRHLKQAFLNLVLAALEGMPAGGRLTVRTCVAPARGGRGGEDVVVELSDTGGQLPEDELYALFEPFFRNRRDATSMGLPMSYTIIEQHGGRLSVSSGDAGTTFRVELPALT